jgi:DNA-binding beta-propeller fold protein YncE
MTTRLGWSRFLCSRVAATCAAFYLSAVTWGLLSESAKAQPSPEAPNTPKFQVDPFWPKPLPNRWVTGEFGGVCVDAVDHVFVLPRGDLTAKEKEVAQASPPVIEFDPLGNVANSWGNRDLLPKRLHGCFIDSEGNVWVGGSEDGIVQKYSHDGSKMLLQIGTKARIDTSDGTFSGAGMNSSHVYLNLPTSIAVDPKSGDVYVADGYGNRRVVVFDREGHYLRQWGRQGTLAEVGAGVGGVFLSTVHCVVIGNDGLVYVCDQGGRRIEVFDKVGEFRRSYVLVESEAAPLKGGGQPCWIGFSPDPEQKFMYVGDCWNETIRIMDRATGKDLSGFGRPGNQVGEFSSTHALAVTSKGDIIVTDNLNGRRIQMFRLIK